MIITTVTSSILHHYLLLLAPSGLCRLPLASGVVDGVVSTDFNISSNVEMRLSLLDNSSASDPLGCVNMRTQQLYSHLIPV